MKSPLVSVVMPVFNRELYVIESIESILNQTFKDFELIVIDDASEDKSLELIRSIEDKRIRIIESTCNTGVASAINKGLEIAKGQYIARMDSDDVAVPNRLERQVSILKQNPRVVVCGSWIKMMKSAEILKFKENHDQIKADMLVRCALSMGSSLLDLGKLEGLYLKEGLKHGEDYEFWSRAIERGEFYNIQEPLLLYRSHEYQLSVLHKREQLRMDAQIRLLFFKKIDYNAVAFPDKLLEKVLILDEYISIEDFSQFLEWLRMLKKLNKHQEVFSQPDFIDAINRIKEKLIFDLFFKRSNIGINKKWRTKALQHLEPQDMLFVLKGKMREKIKGIWRQ